jgi:hypothetical protein
MYVVEELLMKTIDICLIAGGLAIAAAVAVFPQYQQYSIATRLKAIDNRQAEINKEIKSLDVSVAGAMKSSALVDEFLALSKEKETVKTPEMKAAEKANVEIAGKKCLSDNDRVQVENSDFIVLCGKQSLSSQR